jgi:hypothetical protein
MAGEQPQKDMGAHTRGELVVDRAQVHIDGLQAAKGALDAGEALIGADHTVGRQGARLEAGADAIETVETGFVGDAGVAAVKGTP